MTPSSRVVPQEISGHGDAEAVLSQQAPREPIVVCKEGEAMALPYNRGGARSTEHLAKL